MPQPAASVDPARCPLCGKENACAMEAERSSGQPQPPCWCTQARFPPDLLATVPAAAQGRACVCSACASRQDS